MYLYILLFHRWLTQVGYTPADKWARLRRLGPLHDSSSVTRVWTDGTVGTGDVGNPSNSRQLHLYFTMHMIYITRTKCGGLEGGGLECDILLVGTGDVGNPSRCRELPTMRIIYIFSCLKLSPGYLQRNKELVKAAVVGEAG